MSPAPAPSSTANTSFPRVSGDEPRAARLPDDWEEFSPRERG